MQTMNQFIRSFEKGDTAIPRRKSQNAAMAVAADKSLSPLRVTIQYNWFAGPLFRFIIVVIPAGESLVYF